jgi:hypothetical protein
MRQFAPHRDSLARYVALLGPRELRQTIAASMIGRLPIGITGLAILLLVQTSTGSFARGDARAADGGGGALLAVFPSAAALVAGAAAALLAAAGACLLRA